MSGFFLSCVLISNSMRTSPKSRKTSNNSCTERLMWEAKLPERSISSIGIFQIPCQQHVLAYTRLHVHLHLHLTLHSSIHNVSHDAVRSFLCTCQLLCKGILAYVSSLWDYIMPFRIMLLNSSYIYLKKVVDTTFCKQALGWHVTQVLPLWVA